MPENPNADPYAGSDEIYGTGTTMATTNANNASNNYNNNNNNSRRPSANRVSSAGSGYYDIATQLLGKQGSDLEELFIAAARDGLYEKIETFLQRNRNDYVVSIDVKDRKTGNTPLIWAAKRGHAKIVLLLLRHGADITLRNYEGQTAVEVASPSIRTILLESVERSTEALHQLLLQAAWQGDLRVVSRLLSQKKVLDINCQNAEGFTPIMLATRDMFMFERFSTQMSRPYNPVEVVAELMAARADIHASDSDGKTCLHHAAQSKSNIAHTVVSAIISGGANLEQKDKRSFAPIHCASLTGNSVCISSLLDGGSEVNSRGFAGATPLHITSYNNHEKATNVLLEHGANVTLTDDRGLTALDFAKTRKMKKRLQEAWAECTNNKASPRLGPIRSHSKEDLRTSIEDLTKRKKGEVIFEGLPSNPFSEASRKGAGSNGKGLSRHQSLTEKSPKGDEDSASQSSILNNNVRRLGQVRNQKPAPLPRAKSRSTERLPTISPDRLMSDRNLESPVMFGRNSRSRRSFEDRNGRGRPVPLSTRERIAAIADEVFDKYSGGRQSPSPSMQHMKRAESDPSRSTPNLMDIAASCENFLGRRGRSCSINSPANELTPDANAHYMMARETTGSTLLQREVTFMSVQREATQMSLCSMRTDSRMSNNVTPSHTSPRGLNLGQMLCKSRTPIQNLYGPTSSKVIPPTPTFITQRNPSSFEAKNESDTSPRSDDGDRPDLVRSCTIFKDEFVLEDSRPRDPFIHCSSGSGGSDTVSSSSSSHKTPSPRDSSFMMTAKTEPSRPKQVTRPLTSQTHQSSISAKSAKYVAPEHGSASRKGNAKYFENSDSNKDAKRTNNKTDFVGMRVKVKQETKSASKTVVAKEIERETSFVEAIAKQRTAEANAASKHASVKPKSKHGGTILIHTDSGQVTNSGSTENITAANISVNAKAAETVSDIPETDAKTDAVKTSSTNICTGISDQQNSNMNIGTKTPTQNRKPLSQKHKMHNVLQVTPTKLTENIIRTAPKPNKDKTNEKTGGINVVTAKKSESCEPVQVTNVNMQLEPSAQVVTRCATNQGTGKTEIVQEKQSVQNECVNADRPNAVDAKSSNQSATPVGGTRVSQGGRTSVTPSRQGAQSRNSNINVTQSANISQRKNINIKKPLSSYTPRFKSNLVSKTDVNQITPADNDEKDKQQENSKLTIDTSKASEEQKAAQNVQGISLKTGSPTELVPSSVCRNSSLAKSYNMASSSNTKPKVSVNVTTSVLPSSTSSSSTSATVASGVYSTSSKASAPSSKSDGLSKSTSESVTATSKLASASIMSKSVSQMPGVGTVSTDSNRNCLIRSSSMSVIEEQNEQKKLSSSDTKISISRNTTQKRPSSDGNDPKDSHNVPLLPVDSTAPRVSNIQYKSINTIVSTPVIVNPFEELEKRRAEEKMVERSVTATEFGFVIERPSNERSKTQTSLKSKTVPKSAKKSVNTKDAKVTVTGTRGSSARRKRPRTKESSRSDGESGRPKSGKSTKGRARSGKRKKKPIQESDMAKENEKPDVALIGGIGWHLQTSCLDKSDADAVVVSAITSSESESEDAVDVVRTASPLSVQIPNIHLQIPNAVESFSPMVSPRFREVRPSFPEHCEDLPYMDDDGYPPMNLDMTQQNRSGVFIADIPEDISEFLAKLKEQDNNAYDEESEFSDEDQSESSEQIDVMTGLYHNEALMGKLTPIPESPANTHTSSTLHRVAKTVEAIRKFDENVHEEDLNKLLGATPREISGNSYTSISLEKGNVVSVRSGVTKTSGGSVKSSVQSKDSKTAVLGSAGSRGLSSRASSNMSRTAALSSGNAAERLSGNGAKQQVSPKLKVIEDNKKDQQVGAVVPKSIGSGSNRSCASDNASNQSGHKSGVKGSERNNVETSKIESRGPQEVQKDLKQLLVEKMKTTEKMLQKNMSASEKKRAKANSIGVDDDTLKDEETHKLGGSSKLVVPNLDIGALDSGRTDDDMKSSRSSTRRERKYSETKVVEDRDEDIQEAIDEIMTNTFPSRRSIKSQNASLRSASSTLTEADTKLLKQMILNNNASPFHAKESNVRVSSSFDDSVTLNRDNPELMQRFHADNLKLGQKVKAMIDAGADSVKVRAMIKADNEAKQLAKIMNSFKQMELYAGPVSHQKHSSKKETPRPPGEDGSTHAMHRPGSAGGGKIRTGKFTEIKASSSSASQAGHDRPSSPSAVPKDLAEEFRKSRFVRISSQQYMDEDEKSGSLPDADLSFERPDSASTTASTNSSMFEDTIQWKKGNVLGKGAFGTVWCGLTSEGQLIAVKQIELNTNNHTKAKKEYEKVQEEVELLKTLEHRNIVGYLGTSLEDSIVSIFMQFVPGGSIASILARFGALDESVFRKYTKQILEGVEYLHDNDVIHRDIKGGNVMLMPNGVIKLIDFGCAKRLCINLSMGQSEILKSMKGTPYWMAPEVVNETGHGKKSDIWSVGCTIFEMATRKPPWAEMNPMAAIFAIGSDKPVPQLPDKFSDEAREFVDQCLTRDQARRPSASQLLQSVFMKRRPKKSLASNSSNC